MTWADFLVGVIVTAEWAAATVYLFLHPSEINFGTWCGFGATIGGIYHWLTVYDDKRPDTK